MAPRKPRKTVQRVVGYVRISKDRDDSTSIVRQGEAIAKKAADRGWTLVDTVADRDVSATKKRLDRPGLNKVRQMIANGEADAVVVWKLDRIARSVSDVSVLLDEGLLLVATDQDFDTTTATGRAMVQIAQVFAELEAATIGERTASMRAHLAKERRHAGPAPYGYEIVPHPSGTGKALAVNREEAEHVRAAVETVLAGGGAYAALKTLRDRGAKPRRAEAWSISGVQVVLTGDAILGRMKRNGDVVLDADGRPEAVWEPIVSVEDSQALRAALAPRPAGGRRKRATRLLSGLVECRCGGTMRVSTSTNSKKETVLRYACRAHADGRICVAPASVNAELLDAHIGEEFLRVVGSWEVIEERVTYPSGQALSEIEAALANLGSVIARPGADVAALSAQIAGLQAEHERLSATAHEPVVEEVATGETYAERWEREPDADARRALLQRVLTGRIVVAPGQRGRKGLDAERLSVPWRWTAAGDPDYLA